MKNLDRAMLPPLVVDGTGTRLSHVYLIRFTASFLSFFFVRLYFDPVLYCQAVGIFDRQVSSPLGPVPSSIVVEHAMYTDV